jgi:hypothetical protein
MIKCFFVDQQYSSFNTPRSKKHSQKNNALRYKQTFLMRVKIMNQFNMYKFIELKQKRETIAEFWNDKNQDLALKILEEWC